MAPTAPSPKPPAPAGPLLDLATIAPAERPFIRIDGERYELRRPEEMGLIQHDQLRQCMAALDEISPRRASLTDEDAERLGRVLRTGAHLVLIAPLEVIDRLSDEQRLAVIGAFTTASKRTTPKRASRKTTRPARSRRTGASSSRASARPSGRTTG